MHVQKLNLLDIESMIPWERDIFVEQLRQHIEEKNLKSIQARANRYE